jgi:hypothetical protein
MISETGGRVGGAPVFLVSVASKGLRLAISLLFATLLAGRSISVADKGLTWMAIGKSEVCPHPAMFL